jgi:hypothetical protein
MNANRQLGRQLISTLPVIAMRGNGTDMGTVKRDDDLAPGRLRKRACAFGVGCLELQSGELDPIAYTDMAAR